jgi:hypothetical protein
VTTDSQRFNAGLGSAGVRPLSRRHFLDLSLRGVAGTAAIAGLPTLLAACGADEAPSESGRAPAAAPEEVQGEAIVGDVIDFALTSEEWEGDFGWVKLRLHRGVFEGSDALFIRTDTSDQDFAAAEGLVWAPKLGELLPAELAGNIYLFDDEPAVLSSEPGRNDYTPAWRVFRVEPKGGGRALHSEADVLEAEKSGSITVRATDIMLNAAVVKWSSREMPVDSDLKEYLGGGQLIEPADGDGLSVTFKLHECFPSSRYIVDDTSLAPMAEGMKIVHSPDLTGAPRAAVTGRTNVFMNGLQGSGPMGFQPSVFDSTAGAREWSPYWEHFTYAWKDESAARVLKTQVEIHAARDEGDLEEFPGTPDTNGATFTVNCPVSGDRAEYVRGLSRRAGGLASQSGAPGARPPREDRLPGSGGPFDA